MNRICQCFNIKYPIIQGGMIWCSGWELASAVTNAGGLGLIGAGSMTPEILTNHIRKCKKETDKQFGVNIPLLFPNSDEFIKIVVDEKVPVVFTSAGNPGKWTSYLKEKGITVAHVVSNVKFAKKCEEAGVDAVVAEGFEAGGHNGREETTTMVLIPMIKKAISIPLIAAGGIATGRAMLAAMVLGAEGVQIGSRFVASNESSAHENFKKQIIEAGEGSTQLTLKQIVPVRLIKNKFYNEIETLELRGANKDDISVLLGKGRARKGMFEGDINEGELEIGQVSVGINDIKSAKEIIDEIMQEYQLALKSFSTLEI